MEHIVALSGGKDSTALALRLAEIEPKDYIYMCTPTGDELPEMEAHWAKLESIIGAPIVRVKHPKYSDFKSLCHAQKCLPNWNKRFCTRILKIEASEAFYAEHDPCVSYVGLRADEGDRHGNTKIKNARYPLKEWGWGISEVLGYLKKKKIVIPRRTDCARCFFQRIDEWWYLWKNYNEIILDAEAQEEEFSATFLSPGKWGKSWPHALKDLRAEFEKGKVPKRADIYFPLFKNDDYNQKCRVCSM